MVLKIYYELDSIAFTTRFNLVLVWFKIVQIFTKKSSKWVRTEMESSAFRAAAKRREWVRKERERMEEEREAHWRANVRGRGVMRGQFAF